MIKQFKSLSFYSLSPFFSSSLIMILGSNLFNVGQFVYHFLVGRALGKEGYGEFAALISLIGIVGMIQFAFGLTATRLVATEKNKNVIFNFAKWINYWSIWLGLILSLVFLAFSSLISNFLSLKDTNTIFLLVPIIFLFTVTSSLRFLLQGLLKFGQVVISLISESIIKLIFTLLFIYLGWGLTGTVSGFLLGIVGGYLILNIFLKKYFKGKKGKRPNILPIFKYSSAVFVQSISITAMYTFDILLVKHFLSAADAGLYSSLSVLGRIVFFGISPITSVMFPLIARKHKLGQNYFNIFYFSLILIIGISLIAITFFYFFAELPILLLFGSNFLSGSSLLWIFGVYLALLATSVHISQFFLSINKTRIVYSIPIFLLIQIFLISFNHQDIKTVISLSLLSAALLLFFLLLYYWYLKSTIIGKFTLQKREIS